MNKFGRNIATILFLVITLDAILGHLLMYVMLFMKLKLIIIFNQETVLSLCHLLCVLKSRCNETLDPLGKKYQKRKSTCTQVTKNGKYTYVPYFDSDYTYIITDVYKRQMLFSELPC